VAGADFGALARQWSVASNAERGGEFGWIRRGTLEADVEDVALRLPVGEYAIIDRATVVELLQRTD
jgi:parvulin-like peptidyl-prolyl isomerase